MGYLMILIIVIFAVYYVVNDKKGKLEVFKRYHGEEKRIVTAIDDIRCFFDMREEDEYTLDDQTWYDLNMDEVFRKIDRSYSSVGEAILYSMLRNPLINKEEIVERGKNIEAIKNDIDLRAKLKLIFFNLGYDKKNRFIEMIESERKPNKSKYIIYNILGKVMPITFLLLSIFLQRPEFLAALALNMWINLFIAEKERKNVSTGGLIYLNRMLDAAEKIGKLKGESIVNNKEIKDLTSKELREFRKDLGMIFQHFSLLERLNVYENVALPLECWGYSKEEINKKVDELLRLVGLENKAKNKPKHLSGGQKQRVAIARALALNPNILLCDEATSALDPNTTKSILSLLRDINKKLGITIIIVTHQMEVVKEVCNKVAILKDGKVLECGDTEELFLNHSECLKELLGEEEVVPNSGVNIKLFFPKEFSNGSIITSMARSLDIDFSIVWGKLEKFRDDVLGSLIINIPQDKKEQVINYLNLTDVKWEVLQNKENKINNKELERA